MNTDTDIAREDGELRWRHREADHQANNLTVQRSGPARRQYHLSNEQLAALIDACKPSRSIYKPAGNPAWRTLGDELGFQWETVERSGAGNTKRFMAVPIAGWKRPTLTVEQAPPPPPDKDAQTLELLAEIDALLARGEHEAAAVLAADIVDPIEYGKAMRRAWGAALAVGASHVPPLITTTTKGICTMKQRFDLTHAKAQIHYTPRRELHGEKREPAATIAVETTLNASQLAMFSPTLRWSLYRGADGGAVGDDDGNAFPRYPEIESAFKWKREIVGGLFIIHNGLGGVSDIRLPVEKADDFKIEIGEGGTFSLGFRVACHPDERQHGALAMRQDSECEISFESPAADLVEQAEAPPKDKPIATAGDAERGSSKKSKRAKAAAQAAFSH